MRALIVPERNMPQYKYLRRARLYEAPRQPRNARNVAPPDYAYQNMRESASLGIAEIPPSAAKPSPKRRNVIISNKPPIT